VTDQTGAVLPNVTVSLTHLASGAKHEIHTSASGSYALSGLESGDYTLEASQAGFASYRESLTLSPGQLLPRNFTLQVGMLQETLTVIDSDSGTPVRRVAAAPPKFAAPAPESCGGATVGGNIRPPVKLVDVRPIYPINLRASKAEGVVTLAAVIGTDGAVKQVDVQSSPSVDMSAAATAAVREWQFTPVLLNCTAIEVNMSVVVNFRPQS
jgi:TonB family protein